MPVTDLGLMYLKDPKSNTGINYAGLLTHLTFSSFIFYFCVWVVCLCVSGHYTHTLPTEARRGSQIPRAGVTGDCELSWGCWEWKGGLLGEQSVLLTQPLVLILTNLWD